MFTTGKSVRSVATFVYASAAMLAVTTAQAGTVLSEVLYDAASSDNGNVFVELYGTPGTVIDGWLLEGVNGSDGSIYRSVALAGVIPADGLFLIGDDSGDGTTAISGADQVAEIDFQNGPDSVVLRNGERVLDSLGYGDFSGLVFTGEGMAAPDAAAGFSLARSNPLIDTGNNFADFAVLELPTPGSATVSAVPLPPAVMLFFSGLVGLAGIARKRR